MLLEQRSLTSVGACCGQARRGLAKWLSAAHTEPGARPGLGSFGTLASTRYVNDRPELLCTARLLVPRVRHARWLAVSQMALCTWHCRPTVLVSGADHCTPRRNTKRHRWPLSSGSCCVECCPEGPPARWC